MKEKNKAAKDQVRIVFHQEDCVHTVRMRKNQEKEIQPNFYS